MQNFQSILHFQKLFYLLTFGQDGKCTDGIKNNIVINTFKLQLLNSSDFLFQSIGEIRGFGI